MTADWRNQPISEMSVPQWETLAAEGNEEAKEYLRRYDARQRAYWSPLAHPTDRFGRVKTTGAW